MQRKTLLVALFTFFISGILVAGINFSKTKAGRYGGSGTSVGGIISEDTTWTIENSPYFLVDTLTVATGVALTIEPGVTVDIDFWALKVEGTLHAVGNETHRIKFQTREEPLTGNVRIYFTDSSTPWSEDTKTGCIIEYTEIDLYCGGGYGIRGGSPKISHNLMLFSGCDAGIIASGNSIVSNNTIVVNGYRGVVTEGNASVLYNVIEGGASSPAVGIGVGGDSPIILGNLITYVHGFSTGDMTGYAGIAFYGGKPYIANNTILDCVRALGFSPYLDPTGLNQTKIIYNNLYSAVVVGKEDPHITINLTYNWWGTTNTTLIDEKIYDQKDERRLSLIHYTPILSSPAVAPLNLTRIQIFSLSQEPEQNEVKPYQEVTVRANVTDQIVGVGEVILEYSVNEGATWNYSYMIYNETLGLYESVILGQPENTLVKYYVVASDKFNNHYAYWPDQGDLSQPIYCVYTVIPEFSSTIIFLLALLFTTFATIIIGKKKTSRR